jgi:hypothetical protein
MRVVALLAALVVPMALAGCSAGEEGESSSGPNRSEYTGGSGVALAITNNATEPFTYTLRVLAAGNKEAAAMSGTLAPGETAERWWSLPPTLYSARMNYTWAGSGAASHGQDEHTIDLNECPQVTRLSWSLMKSGNQVGSTFSGKQCTQHEENA